MPDLKVEFDAPATMCDGVVLRANIFRPGDDGAYPALVVRTSYGKNFATASPNLDAVRLARAGYIVVIQDVRGRFASDGDFSYMQAEAQDGYDTVEWASQLPGCTGSVGMAGQSYLGYAQWAAAALQPPHLKAIMPSVIGDDPRNGRFWRGGALELGSRTQWVLNSLALDQINRRYAGKPVAEKQQAVETLAAEIDRMRAQGYWSLPLHDFAPFKKLGLGLEMFTGALEDANYAALSARAAYGKILVPAYNIGGWYDIGLQGTLNNFSALRLAGSTAEARHGKVIIGPWSHVGLTNVVGDMDFGFRSAMGFIDLRTDMTGLIQRWFDYWLKGIDNGTAQESPVKIFVMGANVWRDEQEWPLARARYTPFYLHSAGKANSLHGGGALATAMPLSEAADHYVYDPQHPTPTWGGALLMPSLFGPGVKDQRPIEERHDVLVYTSAPLERDMEVTGPVTVTLWAASDAPDTDFVARLVDVHPDGFAQNLTDGIIRARYRNGETPELLQPNRPYEFTIDLWSTANVFRQGHRIRLDVTSANFPRWDRNPNTGHPFGADAETRPARQTILHDREHASHVLLPVIPD